MVYDKSNIYIRYDTVPHYIADPCLRIIITVLAWLTIKISIWILWFTAVGHYNYEVNFYLTASMVW